MALHARFTHSLRSFVAAADLSVEAGETLALVGPSGAGKTTTLRVVAGLLRPESGTVTVGGRTLLDTTRGVDVSPEQRRVGYVFQEYALFPHLDVRGNVRFGARERNGVDALLDRFGLRGLASARVGELSGGERQRVALARALASDPDVLLLDEPLAALDAHTRTTVRAELRGRLRSLGLPTLLVTHDFDDAATLADRVGVMGEGKVVQLGTPTELVSTPVDPFVATFTGAIVLPGRAVGSRDGLTEVALDGGFTAWSVDRADGAVDLAVYPWDVSLGPATREDSRLNHLVAPVVSIAPVGNRVRVQVGPIVSEITAASAERLGLRPGETVTASFKATATRLFLR